MLFSRSVTTEFLSPPPGGGGFSQDQISLWLEEGCPDGWSQRSLPSSISGIQYVYFTPNVHPLTLGLILISLAGILLMSLSFVVMYFVTQRMYSPIAETLVSSNVHFNTDNEFLEIRSAFHNLRENVESLSHSLSQYRQSAENKFFHDLFTGLLFPQQITEQLRTLGLPQEDTPFTAVLIRYVWADDSDFTLTNDLLHKVKQHLTMALHDLPGTIRVYQSIDLNFGSQGLIFQTEDSAGLTELLRELLLNEEPEYGIEITAYIGDPVPRLADISTSYRQASQLIAQHEFASPKEQVISRQLHKNFNPSQIYYPLNVEQTLIHAVVHGKTTLWQSSLRELLSLNDTTEKRIQLAFMLTATVNRIMEGSNESIKNVFPEDTIIYLEFRSCTTREAFWEKASFIFSSIEAYLGNKKQQSDQGIKKEMIRFVQAGYQKDISLLDLAEHLKMSKNYVSTLFKSLTGRNFKDYLNEVRYQAACSMIRENPDCKIREIAEKVGCSTDILHRLFLRYGNMTPSEFQRQCHKNP